MIAVGVGFLLGLLWIDRACWGLGGHVVSIGDWIA